MGLSKSEHLLIKAISGIIEASYIITDYLDGTTSKPNYEDPYPIVKPISLRSVTSESNLENELYDEDDDIDF